MQKIAVRLAGGLCLVLVMSCALTSRDGPAGAAEQWLSAMLESDGATAMKLTCSAYREDLQVAGAWVAAFGALFQVAGIDTEQLEYDLSELDFRTVDLEGDTAAVRVSGEVYVSILGAPVAQEIDQNWTMVKEEGQWRWCGGSEAALASAEPGPGLLPSPAPTTSGQETADEPLDWRLVPTSFEKVDLGGGWSEIRAGLAVENHSTAWADVLLLEHFGKLATTEGYEYELSTIENNTLAGFFVPPGFRVRGERDEGPLTVVARVATGSSGYRLELPYKLMVRDWTAADEPRRTTTGGLHFDIPLEQVSSGLSYPFIDARGWDAYRVEYADEVNILRPGLVKETDFGGVVFDNLHVGPPEHLSTFPTFVVDMTITNGSGGYGIKPWMVAGLLTSEGFVTLMTANQNEIGEIGPLQTATGPVKSSQPEDMAELPEVSCLAFEVINYTMTGQAAGSSYAHMPSVICFP